MTDALHAKLIAFLKEFIEWNVCVAFDYEKGIYICDQCHMRYAQGGCDHEEGCLVVEGQQLLKDLQS
jgi:hypothetical protein